MEYSSSQLRKMSKSQLMEKLSKLSEEMDQKINVTLSSKKQEIFQEMEKLRTISRRSRLPLLFENDPPSDDSESEDEIETEIISPSPSRKPFGVGSSQMYMSRENNKNEEILNSVKSLISKSQREDLQELIQEKCHISLSEKIIDILEKEYDSIIFGILCYYVGLYQGMISKCLTPKIEGYLHKSMSAKKMNDIDDDRITKALEKILPGYVSLPSSKIEKIIIFDNELEKRCTKNPIDRLRAQEAISELTNTKLNDEYLSLDNLKKISSEIIEAHKSYIQSRKG